MGNVSVSIAVTSTALDQIVSTNACNQVPDLPASYAPLQLEGSHMVMNLGDLCMCLRTSGFESLLQFLDMNDKG